MFLFPKQHNVTESFVAFSAGVMVYMSIFDILPEAMRVLSPVWTGLLVGVTLCQVD
jgi:hypothetical protein